ncbi:MAG: ATP-binding protein [Alphaproteobacteria bacterium]
MRLKSFHAKTLKEAMQMIRDTLGEDAVIVATREENGGKSVRVTAAIEPAFEIGKGFGSEHDWLQYDEEDEQSAVAEELTDVLLRHSVPEEIMDQILSCATVIGVEQPGIALMAALEHLFGFKPLPRKETKQAIMLVGPPGSGKTLATAKIAARAVLGSHNVGVISCDTTRAGGIEQLQAFTKLLRVDLQKADNEDQLAAHLTAMRDLDVVVVDTAGINPFNKDDVKDLARLLGAGNITPHMVLAAGGDADECAEMARVFSALGVQSLLSTRVDIARRFGGLLSAAHYGTLSFTDASITPKVADGLTAITPKTLAGLLMPGQHKEPDQGSRKTGTNS